MAQTPSRMIELGTWPEFIAGVVSGGRCVTTFAGRRPCFHFICPHCPS